MGGFYRAPDKNRITTEGTAITGDTECSFFGAFESCIHMRFGKPAKFGASMKVLAALVLLLICVGSVTIAQQTQDKDADKKPTSAAAASGKKDVKKEQKKEEPKEEKKGGM